jgi:methionine-rich copper-binding protein CopC
MRSTKKTIKSQKNGRRNRGLGSTQRKLWSHRPRLERLEDRVVPSVDKTPLAFTAVADNAAARSAEENLVGVQNHASTADGLGFPATGMGLSILDKLKLNPASAKGQIELSQLQQVIQNKGGQLLGFLPPDKGGDPGGDGDSGMPIIHHNPAGSITLSTNFEGLHFTDQPCSCLPPDNGLAVGGGYIMEIVNATEVRVTDMSGTNLATDEFTHFFGFSQGDGGDPFVVFDDTVDRWYVEQLDANYQGVEFAWSNDSNPLHGFNTEFIDLGYLVDFPKIGFNNDAVVITGDNFGGPHDGQVTVLSIDKSALLGGTFSLFTNYLTGYPTNWGVMPAKMHGDTLAGGPMYFVDEAGWANGTAIRVITGTNLLSNSATFVDTDLNVDQYGFPVSADQPGGPGSVATNFAWIISADWNNGILAATHNVTIPDDGFSTTHARWYKFSAPVDGSTPPSLLDQGTINNGAGVHSYMPSVGVNAAGDIGITYMESSNSENISMYVGIHGSGDPAGVTNTLLARSGDSTMQDSFRTGDYSNVVVDPADGVTFWASNEYSPANSSVDIWGTYTASFFGHLVVTSTTPAAGTFISSPVSSFDVFFSDALDTNTINPAGFTVNGLNPDSIVVLGTSELELDYNSSPVVAEGPQNISVAADSVDRLSDETGNLAFSDTFYFDTLRLAVTSVTPASGALFNTPGDIVVTFNEPFDPSTVSTSNLTATAGVTVTAATIVDATTIDYTLSGGVDGAPFTVTMPDGALNDTDSNPGTGFSATYTANVVVSPYPTPLTAKSPPGSLIYDPSVSANIGSSDDSDSFTIDLNAGQTATVTVTSDASLQAEVQLIAPDGLTVLGSATASVAGAEALLQTVPISTEGTYTIKITGANGTTGNFTAQLTLNSALQVETNGGAPNSDDTIGTAQSLDSAFISVGTNGGSRAAVLGRTEGSTFKGPDPFGYEAIPVTPTFTDITATGTAILQGTDDSGYYVPFSSLIDPATGNPFQFTMYGQTYSASSDSLHDHMYINSDGWMTFEYYEAYYYYGGDLKSYPTSAAIAPMWNDTIFIGDGAVYYQVINPSGTDPQLVIEWYQTQGYYYPGEGFTFEIVLDQNTGHVQFNYQSIAYGTPYDNGAFSGVGIKGFGYGTPNELTVSFDQGPNAYINSFQSTLIGVNIAQTGSDYYSVTLAAGQSMSAALTNQGTFGASFDLEDASGNVLTTGRTGLDNVTQSINNFVAQAAGTYYFHVTGAGAAYSLVVTKGVDFETEANNNLGQAPDITGENGVLGAIQGVQGETFEEGNLNAYTFLGANNASLEPEAAHDGVLGLQAADFTDWMFRDDAAVQVHQGETFSGWIQSSGGLSGRGYMGFGASAGGTYSVVMGLNTGEFIIQLNQGYGFLNLAEDPQTWQQDHWYEFQVIWGTDGTITANLFDSDGTTLLNTLTTTDNTFTSGGLAFRSFQSTKFFDTIGTFDNNDIYKVLANAGDTLSISTSTPFPGAGQFSNTFDPAVNVYDSTGTLLASDDNSAADGRNAQLSFAVPADGAYFIEVVSSPLTATATQGEYVLNVSGSSVAESPFAVSSTNPAADSFVRGAPTTLTVDFNDSILSPTTTVSASMLTETVNGVTYAATGVTINSDRELTFTLPTIEGLSGDDVPIQFDIAAGAIQDIQGTPLDAFSETIFVDTLPPHVTATSIEEGALLSGNSLTYQLTFSEAIDQANFSASSFDLHGNFLVADYSADSFSFDVSGTVLTISYSNLPDDGYTLTLFAGGITDFVGFQLDGEPHTPRPPSVPSGDGFEGGNFFIDFAIDNDVTVPIPTPLQAKAPLGSLVYDPSVTGVVAPAGDSELYSIDVNAGQTITVDATPDFNLDPHVVVYYLTTDKLGHQHKHILGHADGAFAGSEAVLQTIPAATEQTYYIEVDGIGGTQGLFHLQVTLSAALEMAEHGGPSDNTLGSAQDLTNAFISVGQNGGTRAAVLGTADFFASDYYSFDALSGEAITLSVAGLSGSAGLTMTLLDHNGNALALSTGGAGNLDAQIANFVPRDDATYYVQVTGNAGAKYDLVVTKDLAFDTENNDTLAKAQDITATVTGPIAGGGVVGTIFSSGVNMGPGYDGVDFNDSNCGCLPPDTNADVGNGFIVEPVNLQIRVFDKATGSILLDEPLSTFFGAFSGGDPEVVFDDIAQRWYVSAFDSSDSGLFLAVSNDANPLDGFLPTYDLTGVGGFPDYEKIGFNKDAIFISFNDFGSGGAAATVASIDKAAALSGTLTYFVSTPPVFQFRAMPPARMHGDTTGGVEWFVSTDGTDQSGSTIRVTELTNYLSNTPTYTLTSLPVTPYQQAFRADQPGEPFGVTTFPNTTTYQVQYRNGHLVTAMASSVATDGFVYPKGLYYQIDVSSGTPTLLKEGVIDPGPGVAVQMPSVDEDINGNLGFSWMESSLSEYLSMWVATLDPSGNFNSAVAAPGGGIFAVSFRIGDYSSTVLDPADGTTFWSANEFIGSDGFNDIWNTHIQSFSQAQPNESDWYTVNTNAGDVVTISVEQAKPGGGQFVDGLTPTFDVFDPQGNLLATVTNGSFTFTEVSPGPCAIRVYSTDGSQGEYVLDVSGATGDLPAFDVTSTDPADGALIQPPASITVDFNHNIYLPSVSAADLTIDDPTAGVQTATGFIIVNYHEVVFFLPNLPTVGDRVVHDIHITRIEDVSGQALTPFTETIITDNVAPTVIGTSIEEGDTSAGPDITYVATFSEPMDTASVTASSFNLHGDFRNVDYAADSFSWDATGTILTINYSNLPDDQYTETLFSSSFPDLVGLALDGEPHTPRPPSVPSGDGVPGGNFFVDFNVDNDQTQAFPVPLTAKNPLGSLIYDPTQTGVIAPAGDIDSFTINVDPGQTITVVVDSTTLQATITLLDPSNATIGSATASAVGVGALLQTVPTTTGGVYTIQVGDASGSVGLYHLQVVLNSAVSEAAHGGPSHETIATAQDINGATVALGSHGADRLAALGNLPAPPLLALNDVLANEIGPNDIAVLDDNGNRVGTISNAAFNAGVVHSVDIGPDGTIWVGVDTSPGNGTGGELVHFDSSGTFLGTIKLPDDPNQGSFFYYPWGFDVASDGTIWVPQPNTGNVVHVDSSGNLIQSYFVGGNPEGLAVRSDGQVFVASYSEVVQLDPASGSTSVFFFTSGGAIGLGFEGLGGTGDLLVADYFSGDVTYLNQFGGIDKQFYAFFPYQAEPDTNGNTFTNYPFFGSAAVLKFDPFGNFIGFFPLNGPPTHVAVVGTDGPLVTTTGRSADFYSFSLDAGQSATIAFTELSGSGGNIDLEDGSGNILASAVSGPSNLSEVINNFVAPSAGTYYIHVTGPGVHYSLVVTRSATFEQNPNHTQAQAQDISGTGGVLGALIPPGGVDQGTGFDGIDFNGSNCGCLPPDTNADVGNGFVAETVNIQFRVFDKTNGNILLDEPLATLFGAFSGGDPEVIYDDIADRWYVSAFDSSDSGLFLAVSNDGSPLDGFNVFDLTGVGGFPDYNKMGFNLDAVFISFNDFGSGGGAAAIASIDKTALLSGTLTYFVSHPNFQFRAMPPARLHGDTTGGVEWFVSTDGTDAGGSTMRVTEMTNYLSNSPVFTYTSLAVTPYQSAQRADQPNGTGVTVFPNTTTYEVQYRNGKLVTAMASALAGDGFVYPKGLYYVIDVSSGTPVLDLQGVIDPGQGVAVQMPSVDMDKNGNLGFTWFESSSTEFLSMWVGTLSTTGAFGSADVAPGGGDFVFNFRIGDYSSLVVDPADGLTFWGANEFIGSDGGSDIWRTHIQSFTPAAPVQEDWYSVALTAGETLQLATSTPGDGPGEFNNTFDPHIVLEDASGNVLATGTDGADGRNETLSFDVPTGGTGTYYIVVTGDNLTLGEYFLDKTVLPAAQIEGEKFNDLNGNGVFDAGEPGLSGWTINVLDSSGNTLESTVTAADGSYSLPVAPGTYTVQETIQSGWIATAPDSSGSTSVTVSTAGQIVTGVNFGNFQLVSISGTVFNDINDNHVQDRGEKVLSNVSILLDGVPVTTTDARGNYTITGVGPGTHAVKQVVPNGYIATTPSTDQYAITTSSGSNLTAQNFGDLRSFYTIDNGTANYSETGGGWATLNAGFHMTSRTHAAGTGPTATWTWNSPQNHGPFSYEIFVAYQPDASRDPAATYIISDPSSGTTTTVHVNQTLSPSGGVSFGLLWQDLGTYTLTLDATHHLFPSIQLVVGSGGSVDADAVMFVKLGSPVTLADSLTGAAGGAATGMLTNQQLQPIVQEAKQLWAATGLDAAGQAALASADISVAHLNGGLLGLTSGNAIWINDTAAGQGWFVDPTPAGNSEFATKNGSALRALPGSPAYGQVDLLTVVMHELGHLLGLEDVDTAMFPGNIMDAALGTGTRLLPGTKSGANGTAGADGSTASGTSTGSANQPAPIGLLSSRAIGSTNGAIADTIAGQHQGMADSAANGSASLASDRPIDYRLAVDTAFGGHRPDRKELDALWSAL